MDERVKRALQQWPNVPDIYGWLSLDSRGQWRLRGETISNRNLIEFINRNYLRLDDGSYAFQNGPQRVHVDLEVTPYVADLADATSTRLVLHTGTAVESLSAAFLDSAGRLILVTADGPALLRDQALLQLLEYLAGPDRLHLDDTQLEQALEDPVRAGLHLCLPGLEPVAIRPLPSASMERELGFIRHPESQAEPRP